MVTVRTPVHMIVVVGVDAEVFKSSQNNMATMSGYELSLIGSILDSYAFNISQIGRSVHSVISLANIAKISKESESYIYLAG